MSDETPTPTPHEDAIAAAIRAYLSHAQPRAGVTAEDVESVRAAIEGRPAEHVGTEARHYGLVPMESLRRILAALTAPALTREQEECAWAFRWTHVFGTGGIGDWRPKCLPAEVECGWPSNYAPPRHCPHCGKRTVQTADLFAVTREGA